MCMHVTAIAGGLCAATFPGEDDIRNASQDAVVPQRIINRAVVQWVFPSMNFSCNGSLTRWLFQAQENGDSSIGLPRLQLWRYHTAATILELVSISGSEEEFSGGDGPTYEYTLQSQLEVRVGYVLGIYLPLSGAEKLRVKFMDKGEGGAPRSSSRGDDGNTFRIISGYEDQRYIPLVAAEISELAHPVDHYNYSSDTWQHIQYFLWACTSIVFPSRRAFYKHYFETLKQPVGTSVVKVHTYISLFPTNGIATKVVIR